MELRRPLHKSARTVVSLGRGRTKAVELDLAPNYGRLVVSSEPDGLEVVLDGVATGKTTPATFDRLQSGVHDIEIMAAGERLGLTRSRVRVGRTTRSNLDLTAFAGVLQVSARFRDEPVEARVILEGEALGTTPISRRMRPGRFTVRIEYNGRTQQEIITLGPREKKSIDFDLTRPPRSRYRSPPPPPRKYTASKIKIGGC